MEHQIPNLDKMRMSKRAPKPYPSVGSKRLNRSFISSFSDYCRDNLLNIILAGLFLVGLLIGTLLVRYADAQTLQVLDSVLGGYLENRQSGSMSSVMWACFGSVFLTLIGLFFCGFCTIAQPVICIFPLFKGLGYGFSVGLLYARYGISAAGYAALVILPEMFSTTLLILAACRSSLKLSIALFHKTAKNTGEDGMGRMQRYYIKYVIFLVFALMISFGEALLCYYFSNLFIFG